MKRVGLTLVALLAVLGLSLAGAAKFSDVPPGHWAEEAVYKLADEGIILGFPDGTYRGNEFLTRYQAALLIYRLLERLRAEFGAGADQETLAALRAAVQELAAELASLGVRVSALEDNAANKSDVAELKACVEKLKKQIGSGGVDPEALKDMEAKVVSAAMAAEAAQAKAEAAAAKADEAVATAESAMALAEANADSIKALNELAVMLNQDVLGLQDRVAALESEVMGVQGAQPKGFAKASDLKALTEYVQALSNDVYGLAGKVSELESKVSEVESGAFSISGSLSLTYTSMFASGFAGYDTDRLFSNTFSSGDGDDDGEVVDEAEGYVTTPGETTASLDVTFKTRAFDATSDGEGVNTYPGLIQFSIYGEWTNPAEGDSASTFSLNVDKVSTTLAIAKDQTLSLVFGRSVNAKFTEYVFDNDANSFGHGIVATLKPGFLGSTITFAYGNHLPGTGYDYFYAGRVAFKLSDSLSFGLSYVSQDSLAQAIYGADFAAGFGPVDLNGEFFKDGAGKSSYYVQLGAEFAGFTVGANYRNIADTVTAANLASGDADFTAGSDDNDAPFAANQTGFGVSLEGTIAMFSVKAHYDNYTLGGTAYSELGGSVKTALGALAFKFGYSAASAGGTAAASIPGVAPGQTYESKYCAKVEHDGKSDAAFVKNLNFTVKYTNYYVTPQANLDIYGDYSNKFGVFGFTLLGGYFMDLTAGSSTMKYGVKVETDTLGMPLKPSLLFGYVARSSTTGSSESKWYAGVKLNEFLFSPHSTFRATYASYSASNVASFDVGEEDAAFSAGTPYLYSSDGANSGTLTGFELSWTYWDLTATFASFVDNAGNFADAFRLEYAVNF